MKIEEAYLLFIDKVNRNYTNDNISADEARFVDLFNSAQNAFVDWVIDKKSDDDIRDISHLLVLKKPLIRGGSGVNSVSFSIPKDYFDFVNIWVYGEKENCKNQRLYSFEIKPENREEIMADDHNKPSFIFREVPYIVGGNQVTILVNNFDISRCLLDYYRYPRRVNMEGIVDFKGNTVPESIDPEFDDKVVDKILNVCARNFDINTDNLSKVQFDNLKIHQKP